MSVPRPHFLLFCDGSLPNQQENLSHRGRWRFVLEGVEGGDRLEASDAETHQAPDRLALLAVVRGLEALPQPSRVTLVTSSRYVNRGLQYGLPEWRENDYCWEHFGAFQPIRNADLWRRIDQALRFHSIHCRLMSGEETTNESPDSDHQKPAEIEEMKEGLPATTLEWKDQKIRFDKAHAVEVRSHHPAPTPPLVPQDRTIESFSNLAAIGDLGLGKILWIWFQRLLRRWAGKRGMFAAAI